MREFWAFIFICATLFAAFATAMLIVIVLQSDRDRELAGLTTAMAAGGWLVAYWAYKYMMALPKKKEDVW
jgi:hypothetical protein